VAVGAIWESSRYKNRKQTRVLRCANAAIAGLPLRVAASDVEGSI